MANPLSSLAPIRKAVTGGVTAGVGAAYSILVADGFHFALVTVPQWQAVLLAAFAGTGLVFSVPNGGKGSDKGSGNTAPAAVDAPAAPPALDPPAAAVRNPKALHLKKKS